MSLYRSGLIVGRFQGFHKGHEEIIDAAREICEKTYIYVGSSDKSDTKENPFDVRTRIDLIRRVYDGCIDIEILPLPDIEVGDNKEWGAYVISQFRKHTDRDIDIFISGNEFCRNNWFDGLNTKFHELRIPRSNPISGTKMREYLLNDDFYNWSNNTSPRIWSQYHNLRNQLLKIYDKGE